ncbi:MAG: glycosyltransferase family 39 protein [Gaiellales bacterium]
MALTLLGALLRLPTLGHQSLWLDELYTRWLAGLDLDRMFEEIPRSERTPYLYYIAEWVSVRIGGSGEAGLRALSAFAGVATIPVAYLAGARLSSRLAGLVTALLVSVNPFLVWYSQEARSYALVVFLVTVALACFAEARRGSRAWLVAWAAVSGLALATHYFAMFVLVPQAALLLWRSQLPRRLTAAALTVPLAVVLFHVRLLHRQSGGGVDLGADPLLRRLVGTVKDFAVGYSFPLEGPGSLVALALVATGALLATRLRGPQREGTLVAAAIGAAGLAVPVALALVGGDYIVPRNLIVALVPILVALGGAYAGSRVGLIAAALLSVLSLAVVLAVSSDLRYGRSDWRGAGRALPADGRPRALVVSPTVRTDLIQPYLPGVEAITDPIQVRSIVVVSLATEGGLSSGAVIPPSPSPGVVPPGFRLASTRQAPTFSLAVFTAEETRVVTPEQLDRLRFTDDPARLFLQR